MVPLCVARAHYAELKPVYSQLLDKLRGFSRDKGPGSANATFDQLRQRFLNGYLEFIKRCKRVSGEYLGAMRRTTDDEDDRYRRFEAMSAAAPLMGFRDNDFYDDLESEMLQPLLQGDSDKPDAHEPLLGGGSNYGTSGAATSSTSVRISKPERHQHHMSLEAELLCAGNVVFRTRRTVIMAHTEAVSSPAQVCASCRDLTLTSAQDGHSSMCPSVAGTRDRPPRPHSCVG